MRLQSFPTIAFSIGTSWILSFQFQDDAFVKYLELIELSHILYVTIGKNVTIERPSKPWIRPGSAAKNRAPMAVGIFWAGFPPKAYNTVT
jgi:hypothetical protein